MWQLLKKEYRIVFLQQGYLHSKFLFQFSVIGYVCFKLIILVYHIFGCYHIFYFFSSCFYRLTSREIIFKAKSVECERAGLESMIPGVPIASGVIDAWSVLLNYDERLRNPDKVARLFYNTSMVVIS